MNFLNWRTEAELRQIIADETLDYDIRIKAEEERLRRQYPSCKIPGCQSIAKTTWATVPVCECHKETLTTEQLDYYAEVIKKGERTLIYTIGPYLPWKRGAAWQEPGSACI